MHEQHKNLIEKMKEVLPKEKEIILNGTNTYEIPYNQALQECISSLPQVMEVIKGEIPNERITQLPDDVGSLHETEYDRGWNECVRNVITLLSGEENKE